MYAVEENMKKPYPNHLGIDLAHNQILVQVDRICHVDDTLLFVFKFIPGGLTLLFSQVLVDLILQEWIMIVNFPNVVLMF